MDTYFCEQNLFCNEDAQNIPQGSCGFDKNHVKQLLKMFFESKSRRSLSKANHN